ncbi:MAG TPA: ferrochelatase [Candidatus Saccharimonadales bacterium]|nr:ferrochelatase [Candidatus Saccharimonadales bacterium]
MSDSTAVNGTTAGSGSTAASSHPLGVLLMTYGSPSSLDDVPAYLTRVRGGRAPDPELATEFTRRYRVIGGSPLIRITQRQAAALEERLGDDVVVRAVMRFSEPSIEAGLRELAVLGCREVIGVVLSPQWSPMIMGGYGRAIEMARQAQGPGAPSVVTAEDWHRQPAFIAALAGRVRSSLAEIRAGLPAGRGAVSDVPVLFTAHSLPRRVADEEPAYLEQLRWTADAIAGAAGLSPDDWRFCWQSAGHEPGEWMKPDFADLMPGLAAGGHRAVLVAPVQFLADHLEILYDVDIGAKEQAEAAGLEFHRIRSLNDDPLLIEALAAAVRETVGAVPVRD